MNCNQVFLGIGSNLGVRRKTLLAAFTHLRYCKDLILLRISNFYETSPVSPIPQRDYLNAVVEISTTLPPESLLDRLEEIERALGKVPKVKEAPRLIDIDILLYGNLQLESTRLTLPHPRWQKRLFVLVPLLELLPPSPLQQTVLAHVSALQDLGEQRIRRV